MNRKADRGFSYQFEEGINGVKISNVDTISAIYKSGMREGDVLLSVNQKPLNGYESINRIINQLPSATNLVFKINRNNEILELRTKLKPIPMERHENTIVEYGSFTFKNESIRTILTRPKAPKQEKLPAVLLIQWLSCGTVDIPGNPSDGMDYVIKSFANNPNLIFYRMDKSGVGDSRGTACIDLDANLEIESYMKALSELKKREDVDTSQIYILGLSLGTSLAPIVGAGEEIAGYIISGGTTKTWYEHMLEFERNRLILSGTGPDEVNTSMKRFTDFYYQYLIKEKTPEEIIKGNPIYEGLWYDDPRHQFGRSSKYYQQIQNLNFEKAWGAVDVPVLALYGEYDWVMGLDDHQRIIELVNSNSKGTALLEVLPKTNHLLSTYPTPKAAFEEEIGEINKQAYLEMWEWLQPRLK